MFNLIQAMILIWNWWYRASLVTCLQSTLTKSKTKLFISDSDSDSQIVIEWYQFNIINNNITKISITHSLYQN